MSTPSAASARPSELAFTTRWPSLSRSRSVCVPLKSKRCPISLRAWLKAFSTSMRFSSETTSKLGIEGSSRGARRARSKLQHHRQDRRPLPHLAPEPAPDREAQGLLHLRDVGARRARQLLERAERLPADRVLGPLEPGDATGEEVGPADDRAARPLDREHRDAEPRVGEEPPVLHHHRGDLAA